MNKHARALRKSRKLAKKQNANLSITTIGTDMAQNSKQNIEEATTHLPMMTSKRNQAILIVAGRELQLTLTTKKDPSITNTFS